MYIKISVEIAGNGRKGVSEMQSDIPTAKWPPSIPSENFIALVGVAHERYMADSAVKAQAEVPSEAPTEAPAHESRYRILYNVENTVESEWLNESRVNEELRAHREAQLDSNSAHDLSAEDQNV